MKIAMPSSDSIRLLIALPGLHRVARGAEIALEELARALVVHHGFQVTLVGSGPARNGEPYRYRYAPCVDRWVFEGWPDIPYLRGQYAYEELTFAPGLARAYRPGDFDATMTCGYPYTNWVLRGRRADRWARRPRHIFVTQNGDWMVRGVNWEFKHFGCDGLVCVNPEYYQRHQNRYASVLIPNGVEVRRFCPGPGRRELFGLPPEGPVVVMVSALIPSKRVLEGIACVAALPEVHLAIVGDGELRRQVEQTGRRLLGARFTRLSLNRQQMPDLYRCADVVLHMSREEPFGNVHLEALASGVSVVAHDSPTTRWILQDAGFLVDTHDSAAVGRAILAGLGSRSPQDVEYRRELVRRRYDWAAVAGQYAEFVSHICRI